MVYMYFATLFDNADNFHILAKVVFVQNNIFEIESGMGKNVFSYTKIGLAPA